MVDTTHNEHQYVLMLLYNPYRQFWYINQHIADIADLFSKLLQFSSVIIERQDNLAVNHVCVCLHNNLGGQVFSLSTLDHNYIHMEKTMTHAQVTTYICGFLVIIIVGYPSCEAKIGYF